MSTDLHIPAQAVIELRAWTDDRIDSTDRFRAVADIAEPVVAAELRRLAAEWEDMHKEHIVPRYLRRRADELDGGAA